MCLVAGAAGCAGVQSTTPVAPVAPLTASVISPAATTKTINLNACGQSFCKGQLTALVGPTRTFATLDVFATFTKYSGTLTIVAGSKMPSGVPNPGGLKTLYFATALTVTQPVSVNYTTWVISPSVPSCKGQYVYAGYWTPTSAQWHYSSIPVRCSMVFGNGVVPSWNGLSPGKKYVVAVWK